VHSLPIIDCNSTITHAPAIGALYCVREKGGGLRGEQRRYTEDKSAEKAAQLGGERIEDTQENDAVKVGASSRQRADFVNKTFLCGIGMDKG
jgi:hypothetical protein